MFVVPREAGGSRLDRYLADAMRAAPDAPSRAELQRWIEAGRVHVDGAPKKPGEKLRAGATVSVTPAPPPKTEALAEDGIAFDVLHEDEDVVVLVKPPGLVVHPARGHAGGTLVNGLLARGYFDAPLEDVADAGDPSGHLRPGIVHRLDRGTSGVMVVARTATARERLKVQFAKHTIERVYDALCVGVAQGGTHDTLHGRHPSDRLKFTTRVASGRRAVTHVALAESLAGGRACRVACTLETGRTHQIRVHLAESGTPVLGDPLYGKRPKDGNLREIAEALGHQALHAKVLGFRHPRTGAPMRFEADPPADFLVALAALRALP